ncbi:MAG: UDP-N-acetylmuramoyl-L-alanyl-D-glutamate--2,6-diaminopimelate ligase [Ignavibacteriales bacterium]
MNLADLAAILPVKTVRGDGGVEVAALAYDSRAVKPGTAFVCVTGFKLDGHEFARDAVSRGAVALFAERETGADGVPLVLVPDSRRALALLSSHFYGHPSKNMRVIGVTGTNGKTTTTHLVRWVLARAGREAGLIGTIENVVCGRSLPVERTTPEALDLQRLFSDMRGCGSSHAVMEVSSHAIELGRVAGTEFDIAVFTNLTQDHLDFHPNMEAYFRAKSRLFGELGETYHAAPKPGKKAAVINIDDEYGARLEGMVRPPAGVFTYGLSENAAFRAEDVEIGPRGSRFRAVTPAGAADLNVRLAGMFNVYNILAALAVAWVEGITPDAAARAVEDHPGVAGRFQLVDEGQPFSVVVDYAHTPDGLRNVLEAARGMARGRVICVFGCGGDRDRKKRPIMGEIAGRLADYCVITSDNPRSEDPQAIIGEIEPGVERAGESRGDYAVEPDRKAAIEMALELARPGDVVVIAGKGHETYQVFRDRTIHFDDREVARAVLRGCER